MNHTDADITTHMQWVTQGQRISGKRDCKEVTPQCQVGKVQKHCRSIMLSEAAL